MMKRTIALLLVVFPAALGCGGGGSPAAPTPTISQVAGVWTGNVTQVSVTGGECLALFQQSNGGSDRYTLALTQTGATLAATAGSQNTGQSCTYTGTAGDGTISLNVATCEPGGYQATCNGQQRDVILFARSVTATVNGSAMTGTVGESWNVFRRDERTNGLGIVTVNHTFTMTK
ncbi:MAG: hypothetical protein NUW22_04925 [Acidobacteria bacterium]|nr:hypothetical protein [Acidobacteriota bacterium]